MKKWISIFSFLAIIQVLPAQHLEFRHPSEDDVHEVIPTGKKGFFVFHFLDEYQRGKEKTWSLDFYNKDFKQLWTKTYSISKKYSYVRQAYAEGKLYLLFYREAKKSFYLFKVAMETGEFTTKEFKSFSKIDITQLKVYEDNLFIGGMVNDNLSLFHVDMSSSHVRTLETINSSEGFIEAIESPQKSGKVRVVMVNRVKKSSYIMLKSFTRKGDLVEEIKVDLGEDRNLLSGNISNINTDEYWLMGTYASKGEFRPQGVYVAGISSGELAWIRFYSYNDFGNFLSYISNDDRQEYINKFVRKKNASNTFFDYRIVPHKAINTQEGVTIVAEACFPTYETVSTTYFDAMGLPHTTYYEVFDGWKYTHAMVIGFDKNGRVHWENSFPIENLKSFVVKKTVNVNEVGGNLEVAYLHQKKVKSLIVENRVLKPQDEKIESYENKNRVFSEEEPEMVEHWYEGNYLTWGVKKVSSTSEREKSIFYCEKIVFRNNGNKF